MRTTIDGIEADKILVKEQIRRLGLGPRRVLRVVVETVDDDEITVTKMTRPAGRSTTWRMSRICIPTQISLRIGP